MSNILYSIVLFLPNAEIIVHQDMPVFPDISYIFFDIGNDNTLPLKNTQRKYCPYQVP